MMGRRPGNPGFRVLAAVVLLITGLWASGRAPSLAARPAAALPTPTQQNVAYCLGAGVPLLMDIYAPASANTGGPAVIFVHGGGWAGGDKAGDEGTPETLDLLGRGYLVAAINYRLAPQFVFPAPIEDVKCAVRYLRANAARLHINPDRIGAWGASAGGHLVSLLGTTAGIKAFEGTGGYAEHSSRVQAVVDMYGRADLQSALPGRPDLLPIFGGVDNLALYSPVTYASPDDPPFLILHGDQDSVVPPAVSQEFYERLTAMGVPAKLVMVQNAGHGFAPSDGAIHPARSEITRLVGDFFDQALGVAPASLAVVGAPALPASDNSLFYAPTGQTVRSLFLDYWQSHGDLSQLGYPISGEVAELRGADKRPTTVQYFERAVLEYHPENAPPFNVLLARLGAERYAAKYPHGAPGQHPNDSPGSLVFAETGRRLGGWFLQYWQAHGGVGQQGYPVSDEFTEVSELDGQPYTVQYFERAVFELHPENAGTPYAVLLTRLGALALHH